MRGAGDHRDLHALEPFRQHVAERAVGARHEARRRAVVGIAEIGAPPRLRGGSDRGDHRVAAILVECIEQRVERPRLDGAADLDLVADAAGEIDIEAGRVAVLPGIVERRIIEIGQEADGLDARQVGPFRPPARVPKTRHHDASRRRRNALLRRHRRALAGRHRQEHAGDSRDQPQPLRGRFAVVACCHYPLHRSLCRFRSPALARSQEKVEAKAAPLIGRSPPYKGETWRAWFSV